MILSAIGLPVPGQSLLNAPPPPDRADGIQAVGAAVAPGGASRSRDAATDSGSGAGRQSARDAARVIRLSEPMPVRPAEPIAGPQPAFEIAVLDKLREDAMRIPPEDPKLRSDAGFDDAAALLRLPTRDEGRAGDSAESAPGTGPAEPSPPAAEVRDNPRGARDRPREPADEGFGGARRMSEERSPPQVDITR